MKNPHLVRRAESYAAFLCRRSWLLLGLCLLGAVVMLALAVARLNLSTDRTELVNRQWPVSRTWQESRRDFGTPEDCIVLVQGKTAEEGKAAVGQLAEVLQQDQEFFEDPVYRIDMPNSRTSSLYFLSLDRLKQLSNELEDALPWLGQGRPGLESLLDYFQKSSQDRARFVPQMERAAPLLIRVLEEMCRNLESRGKNVYRSPLGNFESDLDMLRANAVRPGQTSFYSLLADGETYVLFVRPRHRQTFNDSHRTLERLRVDVGVMRRSFPDVVTFLSGEPVLYTDELLGVRSDILKAGALAVILVSALVSMTLGSIWRAGAVACSLVLSLTWSLGGAALLVPRLNLITVSSFGLLVGVSLTLGVLVAYRYQWERAEASEEAAMRNLMVDLGLAMLLGSLFCAAVCTLLELSTLRALRHFGALTAVGIGFSTLSALVFLPALLTRLDRLEPKLGEPRGRLLIELLSALPYRVRLVFLGTLTLLSGLGMQKVTVDYSLLNLHARDSESYRVEEYLRDRGYSNLFAISIAANQAVGASRQAQILKQPTVSRMESLIGFLPIGTAEKQPWIDRLVAQARRLPLPQVPRQRSADEMLRIYRNYQTCDRILREALPGNKKLLSLLDRLRAQIDMDNPGPVETGLTSFETRLCEDLRAQIELLQSQSNRPPDVPAQLPRGVLSRLVGPKGTLLMRVFPAENVWQLDRLRRFVEPLRAVDPDVSGNPVLILDFTDNLQSSLRLWAGSSIVASLFWMVLWRRSPRQIGGTFLVTGMAAFWTVGLLGAFHRPLNPITMLALPILLCLGLGFASQGMVTRWRHHRSAPYTTPPSFVAGLAWMIGCGCLLGAHHRGLESLGLVCCLGVGMNLLALLLLTPPPPPQDGRP